MTLLCLLMVLRFVLLKSSVSSSCPHLSVLNRHVTSHVCMRLRLLEHLRSQPLLRVHEDAVSYFRPEVVHVYVVMTTRRQA